MELNEFIWNKIEHAMSYVNVWSVLAANDSEMQMVKWMCGVTPRVTLMHNKSNEEFKKRDKNRMFV